MAPPGISLAEEEQQGNVVLAETDDQLRQGAAPGLYPARAGSHQAVEVTELQAATSRRHDPEG